MPIKSVVIVGTRNMAENLIRAFQTAVIPVIGVFGRNEERIHHLTTTYSLSRITNLGNIDKESLVILAVSDDAVEDISSQVDPEAKVVHTSGSVPMNAIQVANRGVFYPLQTMTSDRKIDFFKVPVLIEAENEALLLDLKMMATRMTDKLHVIDSEQRKRIHLGAVILNNFVTELVKLSGDYMNQIGVDQKLLNPLLEETVEKIKDLGPAKSLTGPARRGDKQTIQSHLEMLDGDLKEVYQTLSNIILKENGKL
ncbi:MAG: DUF2520 domain-containing protein [Crocinitomicaceae bacterium]|nr:DUF2520 domain-containing protein [Crocinitomicaceae bacterium]